MRPLRLTDQTWEVVGEWAADQSPENQRLAADFLRALMDGSWVNEFDNDPVDSEVVMVFLDRRLPVYMRIHEEHGVVYGSVFAIEDDPRLELFDTGERLGVDPEPEPGLDNEGRRPPAGPPELYPEPHEDPEDFARRLEEFRRST